MSAEQKPDAVIERSPRKGPLATGNFVPDQQQWIAEGRQSRTAEDLRKPEERRQRKAADDPQRLAAELAAEEGQRITLEDLERLAVEERRRLDAWLAAKEWQQLSAEERNQRRKT